ncbi:hypothetical protein [Nonomuraea typhae]|uniref:hypothetical protein n=1 Tax=Nonomuraea typhae TaxID=2603600 RepID=UPI0012FA12C3|nr:hypothetical protein [Nonomuraea typhae]
MNTTRPDALRAVRTEITLDWARASARSGDLDEALRLLRELDVAGEADAAALDLLARVHAQRGEFTEADACWSRLQAGASGVFGGAAAAGRRTIADITAGRRAALAPWRPARSALAGVSAVAVLAAGVLIAIGNASGPSVPADARAPASPPSRQVTVPDAPERWIRVARDERRAKALDRAKRRLTIPGVRVRRDGGSLRVTFTNGLFLPDGTRPIPSRRALLGRIGERLPGRGMAITVIGHAVAVPGGPAKGGSAVALARAQAVAQALAAAGHLPLTAFTLATGDQREGPYRDDTRNRTVTIRITPRGTG